ncbi:MAG TPA: DUF2497 domain-containing protein [Rhodopila sp.]|jgi:hypothetical protein
MTEQNPAATPDNADPSMEDILASIRRILNEEETPAGAESPAQTDPTRETSPAGDDVLLLDQSMMVAAPESTPNVASEPESEPPLPRTEPPKIDPPHPEIEGATPSHQAASPEPAASHLDLMAPEAVAAAASSVGSLVRTLTAGRATQVYGGGPTLEDVVRSELRPLLKEWLDANLPPIVERLVRAEIERVVGRAVP